MVKISFNDRAWDFDSVESLGQALDRFDRSDQFELWCSVDGGPSLCMLGGGGRAWLMYLRYPGDSGFHSQGDPDLEGSASFLLSNGQVDEYPVSWCIDIERCYKAISYFFANGGERPVGVKWIED